MKVDVPVTARVPPSVVAPVPTLKVFVPVIEVAPLREIAPVPVENVPVPVCQKLPVVERSPVTLTAPPNEEAPVPRKLKAGFVVVLPNETFSAASVVLIFR